MFEKVLHPGEVIELQDECPYCGNGAMAAVNNGYAILTDKRFIVCKKKTTILAIVFTVIIFAAAYIGILSTTSFRLGALQGAVLGAVSFGIGSLLSKLITGKKEKELDSSSVIYTFDRTSISSLEDGKRGIHKMLVVQTRNGDLCKIGTKDKEKWRAALRL